MIEQSPREDFFHILRILANKAEFTQRDLSSHLGFSLGKTNYLLRALAQKGYIKIKNFSKGGQKLKKVSYMLTKRGFAQKVKLTHAFLLRKEREYLLIKEEWEGTRPL